jgi:hypothetical protein
MTDSLFARRNSSMIYFAAFAFLVPSVATQVSPALWRKRGSGHGRLIRRELHTMNIAHSVSLFRSTRSHGESSYLEHFTLAAALLALVHLQEFVDMLWRSNGTLPQKADQLASMLGCACTAVYFGRDSAILRYVRRPWSTSCNCD